jgi:cytochrome P450
MIQPAFSRQNVHRLMAVMVECCDRRAFLSRDSTRDLSVVMKARHLRELLDELMTLIVAGFETSANTLNWVWYLTYRRGAACRAERVGAHGGASRGHGVHATST